jgi:hypothetical protein
MSHSLLNQNQFYTQRINNNIYPYPHTQRTQFYQGPIPSNIHFNVNYYYYYSLIIFFSLIINTKLIEIHKLNISITKIKKIICSISMNEKKLCHSQSFHQRSFLIIVSFLVCLLLFNTSY